MADELGGGIQIPGASLGGDAKSIIGQLQKRADESAGYYAGKEKEFSESREREGAARQAQAGALAPARAKLKAELGNAPSAPETKPVPEAPSGPAFKPEEMQETLSLITALAAVGGLLSRQPLTAALSNFSAGVHGYVQGKQDVFKNELKSFDANLKKANAENDAVWKKYKAAQDKHGTDIQALQNEIAVIAAETQNPIDIELAKRGDIVSLMKMHEQTNNNYNKVLEKTAQFMQQAEGRKQASEDKRMMAGMASADRRYAADLASTDRRAAEEGRTARAAQSDATRRDIALQRIDAARSKGEKGGLKGKQLDSFVHNTANIEAIDQLVQSLADNPDAVGFKTLIPGIALNRADPDGTPVRASIANLTSMTIKDRAGTAQTAQEMKNVAPFIPRDGDDYDTVVTKLRGMQREMKRMNDTIQSVTGGGAGAPAGAPRSFATEAEATAAGVAPGTKVIIGGVPGTWH
jgi:hypothetical protein